MAACLPPVVDQSLRNLLTDSQGGLPDMRAVEFNDNELGLSLRYNLFHPSQLYAPLKCR